MKKKFRKKRDPKKATSPPPEPSSQAPGISQTAPLTEIQLKQVKQVFLLCGSLLLLGYLLGAFYYPHYWGIHHLYFFPTTFRWAWLAAGCLFIIPFSNRLLSDGMGRFQALLGADYLARRKYLLYTLLGASFFALFWVFRTKTYFLGDGAGTLTAIEQDIFIRSKITDWLEYMIHFWSYQLLKGYGWEVGEAFSLISCLTGAAFIMILASLSDFLGESRREKVIFFLLIASGGAMQLYFGYVELYSITQLCFLAFMYSFIYYLKHEKRLYLSGLLFILGFTLHNLCLLFVPAAIIVLYFYKRDQLRLELRKKTTIIQIIIGIGLITILVIMTPVVERSYKSTVNFWGMDIIFSFNHLLDYLNAQLLTSPTGMLTCLIIFAVLYKNIKWRDGALNFLIIIALTIFSFFYIYMLVLGISRDWDTATFAGLPFAILGGYLLIRYVRNPEVLKYIGTLCIGLNLINTIPYVLVNADIEKSTTRYQFLLSDKHWNSWSDDWTRAYAYFDLANYFLTNNQPQECERAVENMVKIHSDYPKWHFLGGKIYLNLRKPEKAFDEFMACLQNEPTDEMAQGAASYLSAILNHNLRGDNLPAKAEKAKLVLSLLPNNAQAHNILGIYFYQSKLYSEARDELESVHRYQPNNFDANLYLSIIHCYHIIDKQKAGYHLRLLLESNPQLSQSSQVANIITQLKRDLFGE